MSIKKRVIAACLLVMSIALLFSTHFLESLFNSANYSGRLINTTAPEFTLFNLDGQTVSLTDFKGQYIYLMFGYLNCTKTCHSQALVLDSLSRQLAHLDKVQFIYISMDPQRDSTSKLKSYFSNKKNTLTVLRSNNFKHIQAIANKYNAPFSYSFGNNINQYDISHPGYLYLINPNGQVSIIYSSNLIDTDALQVDLSTYRLNFS